MEKKYINGFVMIVESVEPEMEQKRAEDVIQKYMKIMELKHISKMGG